MTHEYTNFDVRTISAEEALKRAERHRQKGDEHLAAGRNEHANGSYKKAARAMMKAQILLLQSSPLH